MRFSVKHIVIIFSFFLIEKATYAQRINPIAVSNYGTAQSMFINPSLSGYSAYNWHVNLAGAWANVNNDYLTLKLPYSAYKLPNNVPPNYRTSDGNATWDNNWLKERLNGRAKNVNLGADAYGPSASVKIKNLRLGFLSMAAADARLHCLSENLAHAIVNEFDSTKGAFDLFNTFASGKSNELSKMTIAANTRLQIGGNIAYAIPLEWDRQLILGLNIKKSWGFAGQYIHTDAMKLTPINQDSLVFSPTSIEQIDYSESGTGKGWGYDLGITYVFHKKDYKRPGGYKENQTRYHTKISAAIMDIGKIKYQDVKYQTLIISRPVGINTTNLENYANANTNYQAVFDSFIGTIGSYSSYIDDVNIGLPTRFVFNADRQIKNHLFVNGMLTQSLRKRHSKNARYQSAFMLAPRLEYEYFEFSLPLYLEYDYSAFRLGASMRLGPLYLGTNSLASFLYTRSVRDADIFVGIAFGNIPNFNVRKWIDKKYEKKKKRVDDCTKM